MQVVTVCVCGGVSFTVRADADDQPVCPSTDFTAAICFDGAFLATRLPTGEKMKTQQLSRVVSPADGFVRLLSRQFTNRCLREGNIRKIVRRSRWRPRRQVAASAAGFNTSPQERDFNKTESLKQRFV